MLELEKKFNDMRVDYMKKYMEHENWNTENIDSEDLLEIYFILLAKEKFLSRKKGE